MVQREHRRQILRISQMASESGVSIQALRYYERIGLLPKPQRRSSGYREYTPADVRTVRAIKWAQGLGFALDEIRDLIGDLMTVSRGPAERDAERVRDWMGRKVAEIDAQIARLQSMRDGLAQIVGCHCEGQCPTITSALDERGPPPDDRAEDAPARSGPPRREPSAPAPRSIRPAAR